MYDTLNDGDSLDIFVMNPDGSGQTNLTRNAGPGWDSSPAWSFDGSQIAFVSSRDGDSKIWVMNADGSEPRNLNVLGSEPTWSPDGSRIAYTDHLSLWVVSADGSDRTYLAEWGWEPNWSPDGSTIVYSAPVEGESYADLWTIDIR